MALILANPADATAYLIEQPVPNNAETLTILQTCNDANTIFETCSCSTRQKLALIRQGVHSIAKLRLLGRDRKAIQDMVKPITTLPVNHGGTEFTINIVTALTAAVQFYEDQR